MRYPIRFLLAASLLLAPLATMSGQKLDVTIDDSPVKGDGKQPIASYADVLQRATPSVVSVYTTRVLSGPGGGLQGRGVEELFRQFGLPVPERPSPGGPGGRSPRGERRERVGVGSGVIISENGYVVTNHHVVRGGREGVVDEIRVRLRDGTEHEAELVGSDKKTDVAVLKIETGKELPAVTLADSDNLRVGDVVFAIGNPLKVGLTATQGIVSATGRNSLGILGRGAYENFIQTDASINLGNSGGALVDAKGRLVGINTAIVSGSGGSIGIGFAIPTNLALNVVRNLIETGEVPRGLLGLYPENLSRDLAEAFGMDNTEGALVNQVQEGSPADEAGIRHGDIIVEVDGVDIKSAPQLRLVVSQMSPGKKVDVTIIREGETKVIPVVLGSVSETASVSGPADGVLEGVRLVPLAERVRRETSIPESVNGVVVAAVASDSPYADSLEPSMVILEVNEIPVETPRDVEEALSEGVNRLYTWSGGMQRYVVIRIGNE